MYDILKYACNQNNNTDGRCRAVKCQPEGGAYYYIRNVEKKYDDEHQSNKVAAGPFLTILYTSSILAAIGFVYMYSA